MTLPTLLKRLEVLHRQQIQTEQEIASVEREIVASGKTPRKPRRRRQPLAVTADLVKPIVKLLRDEGRPLPRREIAARLGLTPKATGYRLQQALKAGFVERVSSARYRVAAVVPVF